MGRNAQLLGKNLPISRCLIQHTDIVGVLKNVLHFSGSQQILDVLGNAGGNTAPFPKAFPDFHRVGCGLFLFQQQMEFVNVVPCGFPCFPVQGDPVPYLVLDDQHSDFLQLLTQLLNVIADHPVADIHICAVVKHIQRAVYIDFQGCGNELCFLFLLLSQAVIQVPQNGHILRFGVTEVFPVNHPHTAVNNGFLYRL